MDDEAGDHFFFLRHVGAGFLVGPADFVDFEFIEMAEVFGGFFEKVREEAYAEVGLVFGEVIV